MALRRPPAKKLSPAQQKAFWENYNAGRIRENTKRRFMSVKSRSPVFASAGLMGTIRKFENRQAMLMHIRAVSRMNRIGTGKKFVHFDFQPTQILALDKKNLRTLERVYRAPNIFQVTIGASEIAKSPFGRQFLRRMQEKKVSIEEVQDALLVAKKELFQEFAQKNALDYDFAESNILVLDYNPETKKPLIAIIDHGYSMTTIH